MAGVGHILPDGRELFADVSFRVGEGAKVALVGPNGAGKTTLLRMVAGDLPVRDGRDRALRRARRDAPVHRHDRRRAAPSHDLALSLAAAGRCAAAGARLAAAELAMHAAEARQSARREGPAALRRTRWPRGARPAGTTPRCSSTRSSVVALDQPWDAARDRPVRTLSGGQQKRFALELLLRGADEVLLLDEPDNFLDVPGKRWLEARLRESTKSVLYVSHDRELLAQTADRVVAVEGGSAWMHPGGFASWHEARVARHERLDELRRRWDEEHQKLSELVLMYKQKAAYNDGLASRYQAAQTRLRKFEEAGPPPLPPEGPGHPDAAARRADRQARGHLRAAGAGGPDLPVRPGDLVRRPGRGARRQRHRQVALPAAARPAAAPTRTRTHDAGRRCAARAGRARRRRPGSARGCGPGTSRRPTTGRSCSTRRWSRSSGGATTTAPGCPGTQAMKALSRYELAAQGDQRFGTLSGGQQARFLVLLLELSGATLLLLDEPTDNLDLACAEALEEGLHGFDGHGDRGDPRPLVHPVVRPVRAVPGRRRGRGDPGAGLGRRVIPADLPDRLCAVGARCCVERGGGWSTRRGLSPPQGGCRGRPPHFAAAGAGTARRRRPQPRRVGRHHRCRPRAGHRGGRLSLRRGVRASGHRVDLVTEMTYRRLGDSGLVVSVVGIGCNNFGRRLDLDGTRGGRRRRPRRRASPSSTPPTSTATARRLARSCSAQALKGRRDDVVLATKFGMDMQRRQRRRTAARAGSRRYIAPRRRGVAAPARHRLHRPLPVARARPAHPDRGDPRRAGRPGPRGQGPLPRQLQLRRLADRRRRLGRPRPAARARFISAQNHYSLLDRDVEAEVIPACERFGARRAAVLPARQRPAHRQVPAAARRRRRAPGCPTAPVRGAARPTPTGTRSRRSRRSPPSAGCPLLEVAIGGLAAQPAVASVIAGATTPEQVRGQRRRRHLGAQRRGPGGAARHPLSEAGAGATLDPLVFLEVGVTSGPGRRGFMNVESIRPGSDDNGPGHCFAARPGRRMRVCRSVGAAAAETAWPPPSPRPPPPTGRRRNGHQPAPAPPAPSAGLFTATGSGAGGDCAARACTVAVALPCNGAGEFTVTCQFPGDRTGPLE